MNSFKVKQLADSVYMITENKFNESANIYLLTGNEKDVLIDTGTGIWNLKSITDKICKNPITVINTHAHFDHCGGNHIFQTAHIHKSELEILKNPDPKSTALFYLSEDHIESDRTDISEYRVKPSEKVIGLTGGKQLKMDKHELEVIHTPGHSPGSICIWEKTQQILFTGDTIYDGELIWNLPTSDIDEYQSSLEKLLDLDISPETVLPGHNQVLTQTEFQNLTKLKLDEIRGRKSL